MKEVFRKIANRTSAFTGTATAFLFALGIVVVWAITGPLFHYSSNWQLVINTGTTIVTFLMVFLIQNTQNRDSKAMQLKLDELIRSTKARDAFVDLEDLMDEELAALDKEFQELHDQQISSTVMKKLHRQIEQEHDRRKGLRGHASDMINMLNPLSGVGESKPEHKK